jgi:hypothetical protein
MLNPHPVPPYLMHPLVGAWILLGIVSCFAGYRLFKIFLALIGFGVGAALAGAGGLSISSGNEFVALVAGIAGGLVGAVLFVVLYYVGVIVLGAAFAAFLATTLAAHAETHLAPIVLLILMIIGGGLALILQKLFIVLSTSFMGAWLVVAGVVHFVFQIAGGTVLQRPKALGKQLLPISLCWVVLGIVGCLVQYLATGRRRPTSHPTPQAPQPHAQTA